MAKTNPKPTELAITLAALGHRHAAEDWLYASQITANLKLFGFDTDSRALASTLARMCRVTSPWLERRRSPFQDFEYRVTRYGRNDITNNLNVDVPAISGWS